MSVLNDKQIVELCETQGMITPFHAQQVSEDENGNRVISYGVSSYGYDIRLAPEVLVLSGARFNSVDPKAQSLDNYVPLTGDHFLLPPYGFMLARSIEYMKIPDNVLVLCVGKSTYARCGVIVNVTPLEPGWEGEITLEIHNTSGAPVKIYANEGICQLVFHRGEPCTTTYAKRQKGPGKYQGQKGITLSRV